MHKKKAVVFFLLMIAACKSGIDAKVNSAMHEYDSLLLRMDAKGISEMFLPDGEMAAPGMQPIVGRDSIAKFLSSFKNVQVQVQKSTTDSIRKTRDTIIEYGKYYQRDYFNNSTVEMHGMFKANWVVQPGGKLLLKRMSAWPVNK